MATEHHFRFSSFREKLIEHLFIGELLKLSWLRGECSLEIAKPEVDSRGYDVIIERCGIVRHIQLKTSHRQATAASQKVHLGLAGKPSGCVVWVQFDVDTLALGPFLFFGGGPGRPLPSIDNLKVAKHTKANADGKKGVRPDIRTVPKSRFRKLQTVEEVFDELFRAENYDSSMSATLASLQRGLHETIRGRMGEFKIRDVPSLPTLVAPLPSRDSPEWFAVPGMYGGFSYWGEGEASDLRLIVESWSRVAGGSGQRHEIRGGTVNLVDEGFV